MAAAKEEAETEPSTPAVIAAAHVTPLPAPATSSAAATDAVTSPLSQLSLSSSPTAASASSASVSGAAAASAPRRAVPLPPPPPPSPSFSLSAVRYDTYRSEHQLPFISSLIDVDLSEPYSVFTYRYFLNNWPHLCLLAMITEPDSAQSSEHCIGTIICKMSTHSSSLPSYPPLHRGYIAMLAVASAYRHHGLATSLVTSAIAAMRQHHSADVVVLETETVNTAALSLYERLRFVRDSRLSRYYLNGGDAFRLKLWLTSAEERRQRHKQQQQQQQEQQQPTAPLDRLPAAADSSIDPAVDSWTAEDEGDDD